MNFLSLLFFFCSFICLNLGVFAENDSHFLVPSANQKDSKFENIFFETRNNNEAQWREVTKEEKKYFEDCWTAGNEPFSENFLGEKIRSLQMCLLKDGRVGSSVSVEKKMDATHVFWHVQIVKGEKVKFSLRGNRFFSYQSLMQMVQDQIGLGLGFYYENMLSQKMKAYYEAAGFAHVNVNWFNSYFFDPVSGEKIKRVLFLIQEGPRVKIRNLYFQGLTAFSQNSLSQIFFDNASSVLKNQFFCLADVREALQEVVSFLKQQGYLFSEIKNIHSFFPSLHKYQEQGSLVDLVVECDEGPRTVVQKIEVQGNHFLSLAEIRGLLKLDEGSPLQLKNFEKGLIELKKKYLEHGYLHFKILNESSIQEDNAPIRYTPEYDFASIYLEVDEGPVCVLGGIHWFGLEHVSETLLRKEIDFLKEGDVLSSQDPVKVEETLKRLGVFSQVRLELKEDSQKKEVKHLWISLTEADRGLLLWGPGLRTDLGLRFFGQLSYQNLWGALHSSFLSLSANRRIPLLSGGVYSYHFVEGQLQWDYLWPHFIWDHWTFRPILAASRTQYLNFSADVLTSSFLMERSWFPNVYSKWTTQFSYTFETIHQFKSLAAIDNQFLQIATVTPRVIFDNRDHPFNPVKGAYATQWFDFSFPWLGSQKNPALSYYRAQMRVDLHVPVTPWVQAYCSLRTGYERAWQGVIPLIKQFSLGGSSSLRGFHEQELNLYKLYPQISLVNRFVSYLNQRSEMQFFLNQSLKGALFLDGANLLLNDYSFKNFYFGSGFGLRYETPVGKINADIGLKLNPPAYPTDLVVFHLSLGTL